MWHQTLVEALRGLGAGGRTIRHRRIKCFGAGESQIEAKLPDLIRRGRTLRVGINASQATIILRITAEGATAEECRAAMQPTAATIYDTLGSLVYGEEEEELQDVVGKLLQRRKQTLATAEWGTAGLVADWLGASDPDHAAYRGGAIVSNATTLTRILDVPSSLTASYGPSSSEVLVVAASACRATVSPPTTAWPSAHFRRWFRAPPSLDWFTSHWPGPAGRPSKHFLSPAIRTC